MFPKVRILNSEGKPIELTEREQRIANSLQQQIVSNALGVEIDITTLTTIMKKVSEQKFFEIAPADFIPIRVGEGAWSTQLTTYRSFSLAEDFATGVINTGGNNSRLASADAGVDSVTVPVKPWAKSIGWSLFDLEFASKSGNWDLVTAKEKARKKNWDLGIQRVMFLGLDGTSDVLGLLTQTGVNTDTTTITQPISQMSPGDLKQFVATVINAYRSNCARTAMPNRFLLPESDYLGLTSQASADFPVKDTISLLEEAFKKATRQSDFQVLPCAYGDDEHSDLGVQKYALYNYEEESIRADIPVDYNSTLANSIDNFNFQNVGYGQFTGVKAYRPLELLYFEF